MKLEKGKGNYFEEYICKLTTELDTLAGIGQGNTEWDRIFCHYILADKYCKKEKCLAIRVPGGTVGSVWIDDNNIITKISIDTDYVIKSYPDNVEEIVQKYVGKMLEF